ncbi:hypothetical protein FIBSPDRAFT_355703 [Athelia psychrophila]|uniref:Uncharacterized protein n=1 Tax=Athelia psychrophila TaxID=1759441 RepID=A0A167VTG0_9AGAM|nr:hypothetical protein FIBSPDRAFT_355703 [Fibularhizoctonia sp. CBS 109695]
MDRNLKRRRWNQETINQGPGGAVLPTSLSPNSPQRPPRDFSFEMPLFYAYIANNVDEETGHLLAVFASRTVADEWWRALSTSTHAAFIKRAAPQFYTYDARRCNLGGLFYMPQFKPIANMFRGQMFLTQLNGKTGLSTTIIPPQEITDYVSGGWYHIRSTSDRGLYWHYDAVGNEIQVSDKEHTRFRIDICKGMPEGTIMVGSDQINLHVTSQLHVYAEQSGQLKARAGLPGDFSFRQLESGNFATSKDATVVFVDSPDSTLRLGSWELVQALSPAQNDITLESLDADNVRAS